jgi:ABC-type nitrate/sulfonate/bicarbonate transport system substrate-binding protein
VSADALRIGGVPEHFNLPWRLLLDAGALAPLGLEPTWRDYHGGTGSMIAALDDNRLDLATLLTEGAVAGIAAGVPLRIVSWFTATPLIWGIHVAASSALHTQQDLRGKRIAISRYGSGSHLMAILHAREQGWPSDELEFEVVRNLDGARSALAAGRADVFMWERFMTQPLVDAGDFRRVADYPTPWPSMVVCATTRLLERAAAGVAGAVQAALLFAEELHADAGSAHLIARRYGLREEQAARWLALTRWAPTVGISHQEIAPVIDTLSAAGLIEPSAAKLDYVQALPVVDDLVEDPDEA